MQTNPESAAVEAVAWQQRIRYWSGAPWGEWQTFKSKPDRDASWQPYRSSEWQRETRELVDQSALDALRGEVAASERRVAELEFVLEQAMAHPDFLPPGLLEAIESALNKESP